MTRAMTTVIQKKNDGWNARLTALVGIAAAISLSADDDSRQPSLRHIRGCRVSHADGFEGASIRGRARREQRRDGE
jgi:hypothetical protein